MLSESVGCKVLLATTHQTFVLSTSNCATVAELREELQVIRSKLKDREEELENLRRSQAAQQLHVTTAQTNHSTGATSEQPSKPVLAKSRVTQGLVVCHIVLTVTETLIMLANVVIMLINSRPTGTFSICIRTSSYQYSVHSSFLVTAEMVVMSLYLPISWILFFYVGKFVRAYPPGNKLELLTFCIFLVMGVVGGSLEAASYRRATKLIFPMLELLLLAPLPFIICYMGTRPLCCMMIILHAMYWLRFRLVAYSCQNEDPQEEFIWTDTLRAVIALKILTWAIRKFRHPDCHILTTVCPSLDSLAKNRKAVADCVGKPSDQSGLLD